MSLLTLWMEETNKYPYPPTQGSMREGDLVAVKPQ